MRTSPIDLFGGRFAVIARAGNIAAEENVIFVLAVLDHAHFFAHAPFANHARAMAVAILMSPRGAVRDVAEDDFLGDAAAHARRQTGEQFVLAIGVFVFLRQPHGRAERRSARDDGDLVQRLGVRKQFEQQARDRLRDRRCSSFPFRSAPGSGVPCPSGLCRAPLRVRASVIPFNPRRAASSAASLITLASSAPE